MVVRPERGRTPAPRGPVLLTIGILAALVVAPVGLAVTVERYTYDIWGTFVWAPILLLASVPAIRWAARRSPEHDIEAFLMGAALLKVVVGPLARYTAAAYFYGGLSDAARYDNAGTGLAEQFRHGDFAGLGKISGTRFLEVSSGLVQAVIGDTRMGNFLVFSFVGFAGLLMFYVAFCEALPAGDHRLYRYLIFLTPTMWFWPSSIGKEAVMLLCLGLATLGAVRAFAGKASGFVLGAAGLWGTIVVRPHITMVFLLGLLLALPVLTRPPTGTRRPLLAVVAPLAALAMLPLAVNAMESFFKIDRLDVDSAEDIVAEVTERSEKGGSQYTASNPFTPVGFATGVSTVLVRPFPWETSGPQGLATSAEVTLLAAGCTLAVVRRRAGLLAALRQRLPRIALGYVLAFGSAFAAVGNFGILARQRSLLYPFVFVLVASSRRPAPDRDGRVDPLQRGVVLPREAPSDA